MGSAWPGWCVASLLGQKIWEDPRVLYWTAALTGGLLLGALVIALTDRWRKREKADQTTPTEQLSNFRSLYERGKLSREEYERIRSRLSRQIRQELNVPQRQRVEPTEPKAPDAPPTPEPPAS